MSVTTGQALRTVTFGDLDGPVWGACWGAAEPMLAVSLSVPGTCGSGAPVIIEGSALDQDWRVAGEGIELVLSAADHAPTPTPTPAPGAGLCRVRGSVELAGAEQPIDCQGARGTHDVDLGGRFRSLRELSAWFSADQGLRVTALRPARAEGHDRDVLAATIFEPAGAVDVAEPRLSSGYGADGLPNRVGLELWIDEGEDGRQYPRRAAAESTGAHARWSQGGHDVQAHALRWHSGGLEGAGVYLLVRSQ